MRFYSNKGLWTVMFLVMFTTAAFAQAVIKGSVLDSDNLPASNAEVFVVGKAEKVFTDTDGNFSMEVKAGEGLLEIFDALLGSQQIPFTVKSGEEKDLGTIVLEGQGVALENLVVVGKGVIDLDKDRKTPVAVSTIFKEEIQTTAVGNVEFPEVMKNTPSVYVNGQSGFGDSKMFLRGFDQTNTAFLLNGQPINGMEDGKMYWSNWAGMTDIANAVQVQRGLGSSKLAISSVGGTVNIVTKATERKRGGFARFLTGNDSYLKGTFGYDTGISESGWGLSLMFDHWQAHRKYSEGTRGQGQNFFISVGKKLGDHNFNFMVVGSPQWHGQAFSQKEEMLEQYRKYNSNYGFDNGKWDSERINFYFKPIANLNWDWDINDNSSLSTVLYASFGRGGGTGPRGAYAKRKPDFYIGGVKFRGQIDYDEIRVYNEGVGIGNKRTNSGYIQRASMNNHQWFGGVVNFEHNFTDELSMNVGTDIRFYTGDHFRQITNLYGLKGWKGDRPNKEEVVTATYDPRNVWGTVFNFASEKERIHYDYSETINYQGGFGQVEYATDIFSVFFQGAISNQFYKGEDRFSKKTSKTLDKLGYNVKGGGSYNIDENNTVFVNAGFYSRQPYKDNVFDGNAALAKPEPKNEDITGLEAGYKYEDRNLRVNANIYKTKWANRILTSSETYLNVTANNATTDMKIQRNVTQIHQGVELDVTYKVNSRTNFGIYTYYGDWNYSDKAPYKTWSYDEGRYLSNSEVGNYTKENGEALGSQQFEGEVDLTGQKVWDSPQFGFGSKFRYELVKGLVAGANLNVFGKFYKYQKLSKIAETGKVINDKMKDFATVDFNLFYRFRFGSQKMSIGGNIYNLFNQGYINHSDFYGVKYGLGRTWNASIMWEF